MEPFRNNRINDSVAWAVRVISRLFPPAHRFGTIAQLSSGFDNQ